ncbi:Molybdate-binding periplasmic protein precursor [Tritonibacter multivorans]|uniref:Molybdate-binding periplasmic protein n=1 Tax=Tritonibacter multivorans TaxID=928856 RepID=A0A0P1GMI4_9RHOB|nr:Molybdate-binding periplasmic protein precursor [Tritonibacter multivorans]SFD63885.1 molybdate transport system substrate-binding protein [Tritonibacter multivorans]
MPPYLKTLLMALSVCAFVPTRLMAEVKVFAAASLKGVLEEVVDVYATATDIRISYGSSATMARQIGLGAPADLFISANQLWMDDLDRKGKLVSDSQTPLLGNGLVLVSGRDQVPIEEWASLPDRLLGNKLVLAQVNAVPAGIYAKEALQAVGVWDAVAQNIVQSDNVRSALSFAATGAVKYAVVYETDALAEQRVHVVGRFPEGSHSPIRYPAAMISGRNNAQAEDFLAFLKGPIAASVFVAHGFTVLEDVQ